MWKNCSFMSWRVCFFSISVGLNLTTLKEFTNSWPDLIMVGLVTNLLLFWYKKNCLFLEFRRTKQMSSLFEDVSSCQKKIQDTALYKENNSLWKQNAQNFVFSFCFWFVYALIFKHCGKKTRCNSIFLVIFIAKF